MARVKEGSIYYIYVILKKGTKIPLYVGVSVNPKRRLSGHVCANDTSYRMKHFMKENGYSYDAVDLRVIYSTKDRKKVFKNEGRVIMLLDRKHDLLNDRKIFPSSLSKKEKNRRNYLRMKEIREHKKLGIFFDKRSRPYEEMIKLLRPLNSEIINKK